MTDKRNFAGNGRNRRNITLTRRYEPFINGLLIRECLYSDTFAQKIPGMPKQFLSLLLLTLLSFSACKPKHAATLNRPKLVVGIVIDQMRWDYLYRYYEKYGEGGFKRLLKQGFSCENTMINYLPAFTAVGHTCIFTGSVPAFSGISGNDWIEQATGQRMYCTDDSTVKSVGAESPESKEGKMSPRNLLVSTITDELMMASNFQSKVVGVSLKDRAAILPAGHAANAAFWLDDSTGHFITSNYYMPRLPDWADSFNKRDPIGQLIRNGWKPLLPLSSYGESDTDDQPYEGKFKGDSTTAFPHNLVESYKKGKSSFRYTPFGNTLTLDFARSAVDGYRLGQSGQTDFLTINCASTDYVGHMFGPNSIEEEDVFLRLDQDLAAFFHFLDEKVGEGQYTVFLTADHGAAHAIWYMQNHDLPADYWNSAPLVDGLNKVLLQKFAVDRLVDTCSNYQIDFAMKTINGRHLDLEAIKKTSLEYLRQQPGINYAVDMAHVDEATVPEPVKTMIINGYNPRRSGVIQLVLDPGWFEGHGKTGTTHGSWNPYDTHIPLVFMGWGIHHGASNAPANMTDIAPTVAALLHIQMPNGCVGKPILEVVNRGGAAKNQ
jgi:predicted AlkP superfamily pyrophosphatase or phosphodiesterase